MSFISDPAWEAELGAMFVLPWLTFGRQWTWDVLKIGRRPHQILCVHNTGLNSWEIPERPQVHVIAITSAGMKWVQSLVQRQTLSWNHARTLVDLSPNMCTREPIPVQRERGILYFAFSTDNLFDPGHPTAACPGGRSQRCSRGSGWEMATEMRWTDGNRRAY